jgi:hypothetical protein
MNANGRKTSPFGEGHFGAYLSQRIREGSKGPFLHSGRAGKQGWASAGGKIGRQETHGGPGILNIEDFGV